MRPIRRQTERRMTQKTRQVGKQLSPPPSSKYTHLYQIIARMSRKKTEKKTGVLASEATHEKVQAEQQTISLCMAYRPYRPSACVYCSLFFHSPQ